MKFNNAEADSPPTSVPSAVRLNASAGAAAIAPSACKSAATSNTVAKLAHGIADTMLTNAAIQGMKVLIPTYIMPVDYREGTTVTRLPSGRELELRVRREDAENVARLEAMEGIAPFENVEEIREIVERHL